MYWNEDKFCLSWAGGPVLIVRIEHSDGNLYW